jgi:probable phosphoglycerate mutase
MGMLYLVRHGQTAFNREGRLQGRQESQLTPLGERQAAAMARLLHDLIERDGPQPWRLVSSPLGRARATAAAIGARLDLKVELDDRLMEICVGEWEGRLRADLERERPGLTADPEWHFGARGGETFEEVTARVSSWLADQAPEPGRRVIAVSHGVSGRLLRGAYAGFDRAATLAQHVPQDAVYRLCNGQIDRFDCEDVEINSRPAETA